MLESGFGKLTTITSEEIVGKKHFYDFFPAEIRDELVRDIQARIEKREKFQHFLNPNLHKNGSVVFLETNASPIINNEGKLIGYRGADSDITERKKAEEELKLRAQELERMNNLMVGREIKMAELKKEIETLQLKP
jgi:PAS domain S-box-containing protein